MKLVNGIWVSDDLEEALRTQVTCSGTPLNKLSRDLDIPLSALQRFVGTAGHKVPHGLQTKTVQKLMDHFGLTIIKRTEETK